MSEDLTPSIEIKTKVLDGEEYALIAFDGIEIDTYRMTHVEATHVADFLRHMVDNDWDFMHLYRPE